MKNSILFFALAMVTLFASCKGPKTAPANYEKGMISMKKTACYGTCPVYTIKIFGDGRAYYQGDNHVEKKGTYFKKLSKTVVNDLFAKFQAANFYDFEKKYRQDATDLPTTYIRMKLGPNDQEIEDYLGAPEALKQLEAEVEAIGKLDGWEKYEVDNIVPAEDMDARSTPEQF